LAKKAYAAIKEKIVNCEYLPDTVLNEISLINEFGVSRTPIREALSRLEHENLVRIMPKRGIFVMGVSLSDVRELYQARELMEPHIIRLWGSRVTPAALERLQGKLRSMPLDGPVREVYLLDYELHKTFYDHCENKYFVQLLDRVFDQNNRIRILSGRLERRLEASRDEHLAIVDTLLAGDSEGAANAMTYHLEQSRKAAFESLMLGNR
jgi:DNA-binding GntR family transcriptional regulator